MFRYSSLSYLLLLASAVAALNDDFRIKFHKSNTNLSKNYVLAPETSSDRLDFAVAEYDDLPIEMPPIISIKVRIYDDDKIHGRTKECTFQEKGRHKASVAGVSSLRRLSDNKVILTWFDEYSKHKNRMTKIVIVNMNNCEKRRLNLIPAEGHLIVVPTTGNKFQVFVNDEKACEGQGNRCRVSYNLDHNYSGEFKPFLIDLDWSTVQIEYQQDESFIVRGFEGENYLVHRMLHDGGSQNLIKLENVNRHDLDFVSSGNVFCWVATPYDDKKVHCGQYSNNQKNFTINFDERKVLIDVHAVSNDEIMVITAKKNCNGDECWKMHLTKVGKDDDDPEILDIKFPCTGDYKKLVIYDAKYDEENQKTDLHYGCRNDNGYTFSSFHIY